jgi:ATP-dependent helicase HrpA
LLHHKEGVGELIKKELSGKLDSLKNMITISDELKKASSLIGGMTFIRDAWQKRASEKFLMLNIRTQKEFNEYIQQAVTVLLKDAGGFNIILNEILIGYSGALDIIIKLEKQNRGIVKIQEFLKKIRSGLQRLLRDDFILIYNNNELAALPRYIKALTIRAERGCANISKDSQKEKEVQAFSDMLEKEAASSLDSSGEKKKAIRDLSWLIEEYRISVFAPEVKTNARVSAKIIRELIDEISGMK